MNHVLVIAHACSNPLSHLDTTYTLHLKKCQSHTCLFLTFLRPHFKQYTLSFAVCTIIYIYKTLSTWSIDTKKATVLFCSDSALCIGPVGPSLFCLHEQCHHLPSLTKREHSHKSCNCLSSSFTIIS